jgi:hypothetical protein
MRTVRSGTIAVWLALAVSSAALTAQVPTALTPGTKVRVTSMAAQMDQYRGTFTRWHGDTLVFQPQGCEPTCQPVLILADSIDRLEVFAGRNHVKGALVGGLVGVIIGGLAGAAVSSNDCGSSGSGTASLCGLSGYAHATEIAGLALLAGAGIGAVAGVGERWRDLDPGSRAVRVGLVPTGPRSLELTLAVAF